MKTSDKILQMLKTQGELTAKVIASELGLTTMGVRQHLQSLEESQDVVFEDRKAARGRPTRFWALTPQSNSHFSDRHEDLTVQLIDSVKVVFGDGGLEQLISHREQATYSLYSQALANVDGLEAKLNMLAKLRTDEGYMATIEQQQGVYFLLENHCPICAAATSCLSFCRSELQLFQSLFTAEASISREQHIIEGARRCAYKVVPHRQGNGQ
ncbi:helix-turn-helix transcriptional regulator [Shewanella pneumatophori]|uniref:Transcriptional regulator n=1 Tax=Shewanella pneumatophori TaxID=314092 RepID=A0A9X1ZJ52_9GAMM|nr:metalloregulator ArsR/SmtB family transcription factor [Shewanella pneumatophori]MCL1138748.1 transcriptional regulator [Shewanella pneumatophori]